MAGTPQLVAIAEPDPAGARPRPGPPDSTSAAFADWRELIAAGGADAVVLALGGRAQVEPAAAATAAGLAVLVEKPPGGDLAGAAALARLQPPPAVGFSRRFDPAWRALRPRRARRLPHALELGLAYRRSGWGAHVVSDDALSDLGSHVADLAVGSRARRCPGALLRAEPESAEGELELADGRGSARFAVAQSRPTPSSADSRAARPAYAVAAGGATRSARLGAGPDADALGAVAARRVDGLRRDRRRRGRGRGERRDGVRCQAVLDALRASARADGGWVDVTLRGADDRRRQPGCALGAAHRAAARRGPHAGARGAARAVGDAADGRRRRDRAAARRRLLHAADRPAPGGHRPLLPVRVGPGTQRVEPDLRPIERQRLVRRLGGRAGASCWSTPTRGGRRVRSTGRCSCGWQLHNRVTMRRLGSPRTWRQSCGASTGGSRTLDEVYGRPSLRMLKPDGGDAGGGARPCRGGRRSAGADACDPTWSGAISSPPTSGAICSGTAPR